ncbi:crotonobetainyl-CoA:carnitine CoA-transferase CaiB-like acyl-CoA transferase [Nocardioides ginsengisegetis]|uniref:Crotonobetainyl-CoA:carnitine CoA-transferase CaiB-like acyl-CoA transferase n=1 Tax=Nocardioides ginsengisegetis TaxID=661491 RepID=A0A7W3PAS8_9ACTN|nr:CaiB/BaiF CoA-transferase family protein [Nocardioides ginsengisegetis]MBA8804913.1 crotonobetainyl-CoA:carnitine CoA-transferase CaiB-like acyl-CoA transferase [Nocardioides ginsengisegetis]
MAEVSQESGPNAPLAGVLVVAFEQAVSAPYCTRLLGDLGARVLKVEAPNIGDFTRDYDDAVRGLGAHFAWLNRNKESLALDMKSAEGPEVVARLIARADVVVQNFSPGAAARLGIDAASVHAANPAAVAVDISGYGTGGPLAHRRAYDLLVQAEAGSCAITGEPGRPAKPGIPIADAGTGLHAAIAVLAALHDRHRTGRGAAIEIGMFDVVADLVGWALNYTAHTGTEREPNGMSSPMVSPYGAYPTRDGATVVLGTTNDAEWRRLALELLERPDLANDPAYASNEQRCAARPRIDAVIAGWTADRDLGDVLAGADAARIGCATVNSIGDVLTHPQLSERGRWVPVGSPVGEIASLAAVPTSPSWRLPLGAIPVVGEHTAAILNELINEGA